MTHDDAEALADEAAAAVGLSPPKGRYQFYTDTELAALPERPPLIADILYRDTLAVLVGKYGTYKTFILLEMAFCIAIGADYHGRRVSMGAVLYIYSEGRHGIPKRMAALRATYGNFAGPVPIYFLPESVVVSDSAEVNCLLACLAVAGISVVAVFVDTIARNMDGDENKVADMSRFIRGCDNIRRSTGATIISAHHAGWEAERSRGSTSLPGALDTEMFVVRDDDAVTVTCTKQKDGTPFAPFRLEAFPIAGSLAFRSVVPDSPRLTTNERRMLELVQDDPGLTSTEWLRESEMAKSSYDYSRKRLVGLAYVKLRKKKYLATDAGNLALGTTSNVGTSDTQQAAP